MKDEKDLGVVVQDDLKMSKQCSDRMKKANKILGMIKRNITCKSKEMIVRLYKPKGLGRSQLE